MASLCKTSEKHCFYITNEDLFIHKSRQLELLTTLSMYSSRIFIGRYFILLIALHCCSCLGKDKLEENDKSCTKHADCAEDECCTFEAVPTLATTSTRIIWRCKPLGEVKKICHSLGNVHCPCKPGLRCMAKAVWFFGSGICGAI
ncbi:uncharacterized protein CDAR_163831 [Caerostris darwini]|uniref:Prokineticin domain-containing protein n=1 Tax=Caerostris darwini TaxID=1538125 RepID=A0AAV4UVX9_9ARAC|nr:uncharacterized protein CDAR_163831 [Caerostris darwini]